MIASRVPLAVPKLARCVWRDLIRLLACIAFVTVCRADYLVVSRSANLKEDPEGSSAPREKLKEGDQLRLLELEQTDGYYRAELAPDGPSGWVYRTFVRRYAGDIPQATSGGGSTAPVIIGTPGPLSDASAYAIPGCPPEGDAVKASVKASNPFKNRLVAPAPAQVHAVSMQALLADGDDTNRWDPNQAAEIVGYVYDVKPGGKETCNCHAEDPSNRDTHIELTPGPNQTAESDRVIVEVTPQWRRLMAAAGKDWTTSGLKASILNKYIRVKGWMFFDAEHEHQSFNTEPDGDNNWRATAWEVHPITSMEVAAHP
jgi:hypothetical protein